MQVEFKNPKLKKICEDNKRLSKKYGDKQAKEIIKRINELDAAANLYDISKIPQARLHPLRQNWKGYCSVDVKHPYRIFLLPLNGDLSDIKTITAVKIVNIHIDPH